MSKEEIQAAANRELATQPFYYEIRVKGRLDTDRWTGWFDNLALRSVKGETVLEGTLPDRSALYGLLARLRDLAIPLVSVNVLDAEAQRLLLQQKKRYGLLNSLLLILVYLLFMGGLIALTAFASATIHPSLALALLFAVLGGMAYLFFLWSSQKIWMYASYLLWTASAITFFIFLPVAEVVSPALSLAMLFFLLGGGVIYLAYHFRRRSESVDQFLDRWQALDRLPDSEDVDEIKAKSAADE
jgi:hypothetical protein